MTVRDCTVKLLPNRGQSETPPADPWIPDVLNGVDCDRQHLPRVGVHVGL